MEAKKKRLTLDVDPMFQRRLKAVAALKGISMRQYCLAAIDRELVKDEGNEDGDRDSDVPLSEHFERVRQEVFGDRVLPGNSVDLLREARAIRDAELDAGPTSKKRSEHFGIAGLIALRDEIFGDRILPGNSADLLREARKIRASETEGWA